MTWRRGGWGRSGIIHTEGGMKGAGRREKKRGVAEERQELEERNERFRGEMGDAQRNGAVVPE